MLVAVYGTLRKGEGNHRLLTNAKYLGTEQISGSLYHYGGFPYAILNNQHFFTSEIYEINSDQLAALDMLEGYRNSDKYNNLYNRVKIQTKFGPTYIYEWASDHDPQFPLITDWVKEKTCRYQ